MPRPFLVVATQNPIELDGTYRLPEAQLDRFLMRVRVGYPDHDAEVRIVVGDSAGVDPDQLQPVIDLATLTQIIAAVRQLHVDPRWLPTPCGSPPPPAPTRPSATAPAHAAASR